jgi:2-polyprenyl-3-methyl-5-hydroxy-6-metoxy-1,4-benzoquinol methylase
VGLLGNAFHPLRRPTLGAFRGQPFGQRLRAAIRWALAPYGEVVEELPRTGLCVDMGCGAGILAQAAATAHPDLDVLGVDIDERRTRVAQSAASGNPRLRFLCADWLKLPIETADAFVFVDVLHHLAESDQARVVEYCARHLSPGGRILIKDVGLRPRWKFVCNYLFDLATALVHVTVGAGRCYHPADWWLRLGSELGLEGRELPLRHWDYAAHYLVRLTPRSNA